MGRRAAGRQREGEGARYLQSQIKAGILLFVLALLGFRRYRNDTLFVLFVEIDVEGIDVFLVVQRRLGSAQLQQRAVAGAEDDGVLLGGRRGVNGKLYCRLGVGGDGVQVQGV